MPCTKLNFAVLSVKHWLKVYHISYLYGVYDDKSQDNSLKQSTQKKNVYVDFCDGKVFSTYKNYYILNCLDRRDKITLTVPP